MQSINVNVDNKKDNAMKTPAEVKKRAREIVEKLCKNKPHKLLPRRFEYALCGKVYLAYLPNYSDNKNIMELYEEIANAIEAELNIPVYAYADDTLLF